MAIGRIIRLAAGISIGISIAGFAMAAETAITAYGQKDTAAPPQLDLFSFLVGSWKGAGRTRLADGSYAHFDGVRWIGRYILDGTAIADEFHAAAPDGSPYLGISIRYFDTRHHSWVIEYLNVSGSFLRRQVNPHSGAVIQTDGDVVVISEEGQMRIRERYHELDPNHFTYSTDTSPDGGHTWSPASVEITMERAD